MIPCWALSATGEVCWVLTSMPGATVIVHEACGFGIGLKIGNDFRRAGCMDLERRMYVHPGGSADDRGLWNE